MAEKIDPFDVEALGDAVNDSATRASTIWISFLIFALYLLTAATTVTHRQLLLAEPVKLPVLNIELPLWGFFFLAPILFVVFHVYVLLQVTLLARTAAAYNAAVERLNMGAEENASLRQRLANTLFAQIFAGSPREREGWLGWLLKAMAWITLVLAPILILVVFQFAFLPYHSHLATWMHRLLILIELGIAFLVWPLALDAGKDFQLPQVGANFKRMVAVPLRFIGPADQRNDELRWLRQRAAPLAACLLFVIIPLLLATFPGEPHINLLTGQSWSSVQCDRWLYRQLDLVYMHVDLRYDRLNLPFINVVDDEKLKKITQATAEKNLRSSQGERTQNFHNRDLNCSDLSSGDFRRVDLTGARLVGADLSSSALDGATLDAAQLRRASLNAAELKGASLVNAHLQEAFAWGAQLQGATLDGAQLQGVMATSAHLEGASLKGAQLQAANLVAAALQGASLVNAQLQGASLDAAQLQGASLVSAQLQAASLDSTQLQGASFAVANVDHSILSNVWIWRSLAPNCTTAWVTGIRPDSVIDDGSDPTRMVILFSVIKPAIPAAPDDIIKFIDASVAEIPDPAVQQTVKAQMEANLDNDPTNKRTPIFASADTLATDWKSCAAANNDNAREQFDIARTGVLRDLVCNATENRDAIAGGIIFNWLSVLNSPSTLKVQLARGLLSEDGKACAATKDFDTATINLLRSVANASPTPPTSMPSRSPAALTPPVSNAPPAGPPP